MSAVKIRFVEGAGAEEADAVHRVFDAHRLEQHVVVGVLLEVEQGVLGQRA
jgi:hypothetical protein